MSEIYLDACRNSDNKCLKKWCKNKSLSELSAEIYTQGFNIVCDQANATAVKFLTKNQNINTDTNTSLRIIMADFTRQLYKFLDSDNCYMVYVLVNNVLLSDADSNAVLAFSRKFSVVIQRFFIVNIFGSGNFTNSNDYQMYIGILSSFNSDKQTSAWIKSTLTIAHVFTMIYQAKLDNNEQLAQPLFQKLLSQFKPGCIRYNPRQIAIDYVSVRKFFYQAMNNMDIDYHTNFTSGWNLKMFFSSKIFALMHSQNYVFGIVDILLRYAIKKKFYDLIQVIVHYGFDISTGNFQHLHNLIGSSIAPTNIFGTTSLSDIPTDLLDTINQSLSLDKRRQFVLSYLNSNATIDDCYEYFISRAIVSIDDDVDENLYPNLTVDRIQTLKQQYSAHDNDFAGLFD